MNAFFQEAKMLQLAKVRKVLPYEHRLKITQNEGMLTVLRPSIRGNPQVLRVSVVQRFGNVLVNLSENLEN